MCFASCAVLMFAPETLDYCTVFSLFLLLLVATYLIAMQRTVFQNREASFIIIIIVSLLRKTEHVSLLSQSFAILLPSIGKPAT